MKPSSGNVLGYATATLHIALIAKLIRKGVLTEDEAKEIVTDAKMMLEPVSGTVSAHEAIRWLDVEIGPMIARAANR
jgi:polyhydroxyalkanoate synthesis regulator phasin